MRFPILIGALALGLTACGPEQLDITSAPQSMKKLRTIPQDRSLGSSVATVRTYVEQGDETVEVAGVRCTVRSRDVSATVTTPALVRLPLYVQGARFADRGRPSDLTLSCKAPQGSGVEVVEPGPVGQSTSTDHSTVYANGQPAAGSVSTTTFHSQLSSSYPWGYGARLGVVLK